MNGADRVPAGARSLVALFLAAILASAVVLWEPWPLSSFRLFSQLRTERQVGWVATTVDPNGAEQSYPLGALPRGYRGFGFTMAEFVSADPQRRDELCRTWVNAVPSLLDRAPPDQVRIYYTVRDLSRREGDRSPPAQGELRYICTERGSRDA